MTEEGLRFLSQWEGCRLEVYQDAAGYPTIGVGHLICDGEDFGAGITQEKALEILSEDVKIAEDCVLSAVSVPLEPHQIDALTSFTFNCGIGAFRKSTLLKRINAGQLDDVPRQLSRWNKAGGKVLKGLERRREAEGRLFSNGEYHGP